MLEYSMAFRLIFALFISLHLAHATYLDNLIMASHPDWLKIDAEFANLVAKGANQQVIALSYPTVFSFIQCVKWHKECLTVNAKKADAFKSKAIDNVAKILDDWKAWNLVNATATNSRKCIDIRPDQSQILDMVEALIRTNRTKEELGKLIALLKGAFPPKSSILPVKYYAILLKLYERHDPPGNDLLLLETVLLGLTDHSDSIKAQGEIISAMTEKDGSLENVSYKYENVKEVVLDQFKQYGSCPTNSGIESFTDLCTQFHSVIENSMNWNELVQRSAEIVKNLETSGKKKDVSIIMVARSIDLFLNLQRNYSLGLFSKNYNLMVEFFQSGNPNANIINQYYKNHKETISVIKGSLDTAKGFIDAKAAVDRKFDLKQQHVAKKKKNAETGQLRKIREEEENKKIQEKYKGYIAQSAKIQSTEFSKQQKIESNPPLFLGEMDDVQLNRLEVLFKEALKGQRWFELVKIYNLLDYFLWDRFSIDKRESQQFLNIIRNTLRDMIDNQLVKGKVPFNLYLAGFTWREVECLSEEKRLLLIPSDASIAKINETLFPSTSAKILSTCRQGLLVSKILTERQKFYDAIKVINDSCPCNSPDKNSGDCLKRAAGIIYAKMTQAELMIVANPNIDMSQYKPLYADAFSEAIPAYNAIFAKFDFAKFSGTGDMLSAVSLTEVFSKLEALAAVSQLAISWKIARQADPSKRNFIYHNRPDFLITEITSIFSESLKTNISGKFQVLLVASYKNYIKHYNGKEGTLNNYFYNIHLNMAKLQLQMNQMVPAMDNFKLAFSSRINTDPARVVRQTFEKFLDSIAQSTYALLPSMKNDFAIQVEVVKPPSKVATAANVSASKKIETITQNISNLSKPFDPKAPSKASNPPSSVRPPSSSSQVIRPSSSAAKSDTSSHVKNVPPPIIPVISSSINLDTCTEKELESFIKTKYSNDEVLHHLTVPEMQMVFANSKLENFWAKYSPKSLDIHEYALQKLSPYVLLDKHQVTNEDVSIIFHLQDLNKFPATFQKMHGIVSSIYQNAHKSQNVADRKANASAAALRLHVHRRWLPHLQAAEPSFDRIARYLREIYAA